MAVLRRTAQADEDLIEIWLYVAQDDPMAADRLLERIEEKCLLVAEHPGMGQARADIAAQRRSGAAARLPGRQLPYPVLS